MQIAKEFHNKDDAQTGILNYYEAFSTFKDYQNLQAMGMCLNNIGCLKFLRGEYLDAEKQFKAAVKLCE
jgi:hypothetical protein